MGHCFGACLDIHEVNAFFQTLLYQIQLENVLAEAGLEVSLVDFAALGIVQLDVAASFGHAFKADGNVAC